MNWEKIPGPSKLTVMLSGPAESDNVLSFSGDRIGHSQTAPLLKTCVTKDVIDIGPGREIDSSTLLEFLASGRNTERLSAAPGRPRQHAAVELATKWGTVADCVFRSNSWKLCDIDNRALAVQAATTFVVQADQIVSKPESFAADQTEIDSLTQVKSRVLDSLQYLVRTGVLIASDFASSAPAAVRRTLGKADAEQNACAS